MIYLELGQILDTYVRIMEQTGGGAGLRDLGTLESAIAQPRMTFGGEDLYPTIVEKASALGFSIIKNHPFVDGNKRIGYLAVEAFLMRNCFELSGVVDEQESVILRLAAGELGRDAFTEWLRSRIIPRTS